MKVALLPLGAVSAATLHVNTTKIAAGGAVNVSWSGVDLKLIKPLHLHFYDDDSHVSHWRLEGGQSLWLGQFSPPVMSKNDIRMSGSPLNRAEAHNISTEGTPPFTAPAPNKFISGAQLSRGFHPFIVSNMRAEVNWVLCAGDMVNSSSFEVLAISPSVSLTDAASPMHLRLARTSSLDEMRVSWTSAQASGTHEVQWGTSPSALSSTTAAKTHTYAASDLCSYPANDTGFHQPGHFHEAVLSLPCDRPTGMQLHYRVGSQEYGWSSVRSFTAPTPAKAGHGVGAPALSVVVTADMGETYEDGSQYHWEEPAAVNTTVHIARLLKVNGGVGLDLVMHPGDLAYATGYESEWDRFMAQIEPLSAHVPYMTAMGNHERDFPNSGAAIGKGDSGGECGVPTQARFHMPTCPQPNVAPCIGQMAGAHSGLSLAPGSAKRRLAGPVGSADDGWYSFNQGPVHFAVMTTEHASTRGSRQHAFFEADLAAVDRKVTPWVLFLGHRQMYSGNSMRCVV